MRIDQILFVGLGGAGQRHLRIFKGLLPAETKLSAYRSTMKTPTLNPDFSVNEGLTLEEKYDLTVFRSLDEAMEQRPNLAVISTPTALHGDVARTMAENGISVFVEKPFSHNLDGFSTFRDTILEKHLIFFISFQRRFHPYIKKAKELIAAGAIGKVVNAVFNVGSYVPAWHRYEDFLDLYACRKSLGGGVLLTEIHELDLCYWFFGFPKTVSCVGGNYSHVEMDVEDTAHLTLTYEDFAVQVNLCFMQQHNRRDFYVSGTEGYIEWDVDGNRLNVESYAIRRCEELSDPEYTNDMMFVSQASHFLDHVSPADTESALETARASLAIVEAAKESMAKGIDVRVKA